jgi:phage-related minor tail protein
MGRYQKSIEELKKELEYEKAKNQEIQKRLELERQIEQERNKYKKPSIWERIFGGGGGDMDRDIGIRL